MRSQGARGQDPRGRRRLRRLLGGAPLPLCAEIFGETLGDRPNQSARQREDVSVSAADLLAVDRTPGRRTEQGRDNVSIGIHYLHAWLTGNGAAAIHNLMVDAATAEISRSQVWQWVRNGATTETGDVITREAVERIVEQEYAGLVQDADQANLPLWETARALFVESALGEEFTDFLTLPAYQAVLAAGG